jgi:hypothetical protein
MDGAEKTFASREDAARPERRNGASRSRGGLSAARIAQQLDAWRTRELEQLDREWRTLSYAELEDLYSEMTLALLQRPYRNEGQLRHALREGMRYRALNAYNALVRRREILAESENGMSALQAARSAEETPEQIALARQDELLLNELVRELTPFQQQVFDLTTEGKRYKAIAAALGVPAAQARSATRACESKGKTFLFLYESGRLCGYRTETITALQEGKATSEQLAELAIAHLENCPHCCAEHRTNGPRLRRRFNQQASALMPPALIVRWSLFTQTGRSRALQRLLPDTAAGRELIRERAAALIATGGAGAKITATALLGAAALAGGISATHVLEHRHTRASGTHLATAPRPVKTATLNIDQYNVVAQAQAVEPRPRSRATGGHSPGRVDPARHPRRATHAGQREPAGFAYLGLPASPPPKATPPSPPEQSGGGPFGP